MRASTIGRVAAGAVERLLDGEHVGVGGGLLEERLHARWRTSRRGGAAGRRAPRIAAKTSLALRRSRRPARSGCVVGDERRVVQLGPVEVGDEVEPGEVERRRQPVDLALVDAELADQQVAGRRSSMSSSTSRRTGGPNRRRGSSFSSACSRFSASSSSTSRSSLRVTRNVWCSRTSMPGNSWSRCAAMTSSSGTNRAVEVGRRRVGGRSTRMKPGQQRRHLDPGEVLVAGHGVAHDDGEVQRQPGDVGERVRRVDGQRGQDREDLLAEHAVQRRPARPRSSSSQRTMAMPSSASAGRTSSSKTAACRRHAARWRDQGDLLQHLARLEARRRSGRRGRWRCGA